MESQLKLDFYEVGSQPVIVVRNSATGVALQSWRPYAAQGNFVRDDRYIADIDEDRDSEIYTISAQEFGNYCSNNNIAIPHPSFFSSKQVLNHVATAIGVPSPALARLDFLHATQPAPDVTQKETILSVSYARFMNFLKRQTAKMVP